MKRIDINAYLRDNLENNLRVNLWDRLGINLNFNLWNNLEDAVRDILDGGNINIPLKDDLDIIRKLRNEKNKY